MNTKQLIAFLLLLIVAQAHAAYRPVRQTNDVSSAMDPYRNAITMSQGDSLDYWVWAKDGRQPLQLTGSSWAVLAVASWTNSDETWLTSTGTVQVATNGLVRITVGASETWLPASNYMAEVRAYSLHGADTQAVTIARSMLTILPSLQAGHMRTSPLSPPWQFDVTINNYGSSSYGTTSDDAYRGDWGLAASNTAFSAYLLSQDANTRSIAAGGDATNALIRAGGAGVAATNAQLAADSAGLLGTNNAAAIAAIGWNRVEPTILTAVDGTLTIPYTNSRTFAATLSGAATVTVDTASFTTNDIFAVRLDIDGSSLALTFPTSVVHNTGYYSSTNVTINANGRTTLFLDKQWKGSFPCRIADF